MRSCTFLLKTKRTERTIWFCSDFVTFVARSWFQYFSQQHREGKQTVVLLLSNSFVAHAHDHATAATMTSPIQTTGKPRHSTPTDRWTGDVGYSLSDPDILWPGRTDEAGCRPTAARYHQVVIIRHALSGVFCFFLIFCFFVLAILVPQIGIIRLPVKTICHRGYRCSSVDATMTLEDELTTAAATGNTADVESLLRAGAQVNGVNCFGRTALQVSVYQMRLVAVQLQRGSRTELTSLISSNDNQYCRQGSHFRPDHFYWKSNPPQSDVLRTGIKLGLIFYWGKNTMQVCFRGRLMLFLIKLNKKSLCRA